jgi:ATP-dependent Clp protease, protease subunit
MGLQIREMMYEKIKINKIMSRITGKSEEQVLWNFLYDT